MYLWWIFLGTPQFDVALLKSLQLVVVEYVKNGQPLVTITSRIPFPAMFALIFCSAYAYEVGRVFNQQPEAEQVGSITVHIESNLKHKFGFVKCWRGSPSIVHRTFE